MNKILKNGLDVLIALTLSSCANNKIITKDNNDEGNPLVKYYYSSTPSYLTISENDEQIIVQEIYINEDSTKFLSIQYIDYKKDYSLDEVRAINIIKNNYKINKSSIFLNINVDNDKALLQKLQKYFLDDVIYLNNK